LRIWLKWVIFFLLANFLAVTSSVPHSPIRRFIRHRHMGNFKIIHNCSRVIIVLLSTIVINVECPLGKKIFPCSVNCQSVPRDAVLRFFSAPAISPRITKSFGLKNTELHDLKLNRLYVLCSKLIMVVQNWLHKLSKCENL
jgi:hypothetical protein